MENVHKHSAFKQSCIYPARPAKNSSTRPSMNRSRRRNTQRGNTTSSSQSLGHDDDPLLLLHSAMDLHGDFDHELDSKFRSTADHHRRKNNCVTDSEEEGDEEVEDLFSLKSNVLDELEKENYRFRSMSDFYESIPDYTDLHHLSETEFYSQLERLKIQQQELMDLVSVVSTTSPRAVATNNCEPVSRPKLQTNKDRDLINDDHVLENEKNYLRPDKVHPEPEEDECNSINPRPTSSLHSKTKKSVRISSGTTCKTDFSDIFYDDPCDSLRKNVTNTRSKSVSPSRTRSLTVPKPFKMTQREEEEKMLEDLANSKSYLSKISINFDDHLPLETSRHRPPKIKPFKANPVPLTSRIPLYEHIKEDHRRKSALAKLNSAIELQAQIKPFKFSGEKPSSARCISRATSTPNLSNGEVQRSSFKANPCPKNLFSNYFYNKMWEDDYFRALNRKIRAEEMLKISNLPPSMAKRVEAYSSDFEVTSKMHKSRRKKRKGRKMKQYEFKDKDTGQGPQRSSSCSTKQTNRQLSLPSNSSMVSSSCETTPIPSSYPVNRPNLAATLRVQSARQKVRELAKPRAIVPENKLTARGSSARGSSGSNWGVKKAQAWRSLNYDPSNVEDIAVRLATRRAEQRLRQEEHEISMELMKQRVRAAPLLLEGPTYWGPKVGQLSHHCRGESSVDPPVMSSRKSTSNRRRVNSSKLSFYSAKE